MLPATISASCAFMLPVATPPNAIIFGSGKIPIGRMAKIGLLLNITCKIQGRGKFDGIWNYSIQWVIIRRNGWIKEEDLKDQEKYIEEALHFFDGGFNCAEAVLYAIGKIFEMDIDEAQKAATGFGGGIARYGHLCGAVTGSVMAASLFLGRTTPDDIEAKTATYAVTGRLVNIFEEEFGAVNCKELIGVDLNTPDGLTAYMNHLHYNQCSRQVRFAIRAAVSELSAKSKRLF